MNKRTPAAAFLFVVRIMLITAIVGFSVQSLVNPAGKAVFGAYWPLASLFVPLISFGLLFKVLLLFQIAREIDIVPQTPIEFAGVQDKTALLVAPAAPLPEVPASGGKNTKPAAAPELDFRGLEATTSELLALGFTVVGEGALKTNKTNGPSMFARMFVHPSGAFAEIYQAFPLIGKALPLTTAIFTFYPDKWTVADSNQKSSWMTWMWRRPRSIVKSFEPGTTVREMWQVHQARRAIVEAGLGLTPRQHLLQDHVELMRESLTWIRRVMIRRSILVAVIQHRFFRPPNREWWGEYHKFAKA